MARRRRWQRGNAFLPIQERADHGPRERWQHSERVMEATERAGVFAARTAEEHILDRLRVMGFIDDRARQAGLRLRSDFRAAHLENRVTASYNPARGINHGGYREYERSDMEEAAYQRWRRALRAVEGVSRSALLDVCCHGKPPTPAILQALQAGLSKLCDWYGMRD